MSLNACVWKKNMWKENEMSKNKGKKNTLDYFFIVISSMVIVWNYV